MHKQDSERCNTKELHMDKWKVILEPAGKEKFRVYKLVDSGRRDCISNRRYLAGGYKAYKDAEKAAEYMNIMEGRSDY